MGVHLCVHARKRLACEHVPTHMRVRLIVAIVTLGIGGFSAGAMADEKCNTTLWEMSAVYDDGDVVDIAEITPWLESIITDCGARDGATVLQSTQSTPLECFPLSVHQTNEDSVSCVVGHVDTLIDKEPCEGGTSAITWSYSLTIGPIGQLHLPRTGTAGSTAELIIDDDSRVVFSGHANTKAPLDTFDTTWYSGLQATVWVFLGVAMSGDASQVPACQYLVGVNDVLKQVTVEATGFPLGLNGDLLAVNSYGTTCLIPCG